MQPDDLPYSDGPAALRALQEAAQANRQAWDAKTRLNKALDGCERVIRETAAVMQAALQSVTLFAASPAGLGIDMTPEFRNEMALTEEALSQIEQDVYEIAAQRWGQE